MQMFTDFLYERYGIMAIWQFDFHVVPNDFLNVRNGDNDEYLWDHKKIDRKSIQAPEFLKVIRSDDHEIQWGDYDKTCINFSFENNYLLEIFCRLDLREVNIDLIKKIVFYFQQMGGSILYDNKIYELSGEVLKKLILSSNSYKFCAAPLDFLNGLKNNENLLL